MRARQWSYRSASPAEGAILPKRLPAEGAGRFARHGLELAVKVFRVLVPAPLGDGGDALGAGEQQFFRPLDARRDHVGKEGGAEVLSVQYVEVPAAKACPRRRLFRPPRQLRGAEDLSLRRRCQGDIIRVFSKSRGAKKSSARHGGGRACSFLF